MTETKFKRLVRAITVGAVLLILVLCSILIYQLVSIFIERKEHKNYNEEIARYQSLTEEEQKTLEARKDRWWIEREARKRGYRYPDEIKD